MKRYWLLLLPDLHGPLPVALYSKIASPLQLLASRVASTVMNATGVPVLCEGNRMTLPGGLQMFVAEACSGMRQMTGFPGIDDGCGVLDHAAGLVSRRHHYLGVADRDDGEHRPRDADRLHHAFRQSAVRLGTYHTLEGLLMMGFGLFLLHSECWHSGSHLQISPATVANRRSRRRSDATAGGRVFVSDARADPASRINHRPRTARRSHVTIQRTLLCVAILSTGLAAQAGLERLNQTERPPLRQPLASIPFELGDWVGKDEQVDPDIVVRAQTTEYLNRIYENRKQPGAQLRLWINYSLRGNKPAPHAGDLPAFRGMDQDRVADPRAGDSVGPRQVDPGHAAWVTSQGELVEHVGFWYYIFGEGKLENYVRQLPITSRSSHGQTTRGSSMTVEVFYPGDNDPRAKH